MPMTNEELAAFMYQRTHEQNKRDAYNQRVNLALGLVSAVGSVVGAATGIAGITTASERIGAIGKTLTQPPAPTGPGATTTTPSGPPGKKGSGIVTILIIAAVVYAVAA